MSSFIKIIDFPVEEAPYVEEVLGGIGYTPDTSTHERALRLRELCVEWGATEFVGNYIGYDVAFPYGPFTAPAGWLEALESLNVTVTSTDVGYGDGQGHFVVKVNRD